MTRKRTIVVAVAAVVVLAAAFWWLDFRAAQSETRASSSVATFSSGLAEERLKEQGRSGLSVYVAGEDDLAAPLARELRRTLPASRFFAEVVLLDQLPERVEGNALLVEIAARDVFWTPVYSRSRFEVATAFSTNGDLSWRHNAGVVMTPEDPAIMVRGKYEFEDTSRSLAGNRPPRGDYDERGPSNGLQAP